MSFKNSKEQRNKNSLNHHLLITEIFKTNQGLNLFREKIIIHPEIILGNKTMKTNNKT